MDLALANLIDAYMDAYDRSEAFASEMFSTTIVPAEVGEGETGSAVPGMVVVCHPLWHCSCASEVVLRALRQCTCARDFYGMVSAAGVAWTTDEGKKSEPGTTYYR